MLYGLKRKPEGKCGFQAQVQSIAESWRNRPECSEHVYEACREELHETSEGVIDEQGDFSKAISPDSAKR